jgi:hypothetical protein
MRFRHSERDAQPSSYVRRVTSLGEDGNWLWQVRPTLRWWNL